MKLIPPGSTIGILSGGQLGRMTAMAAARLGYRTHIFCPGTDEPAVAVADAHTCAPFTDRAALEQFARATDVVTLEWENVPLDAMAAIAPHVGLHPSANVLRIAQDRALEKTFAREAGIATTDYATVNSPAELEKVLEKFLPQSRLREAQSSRGEYKSSAILKSARMGYDGKGQVKITPDTVAADAWKAMGGETGILEAFVDFACEISVIIARRADGATAAYPAVENIHRNHILAETHAPANIDAAVAREAEHVARQLAEKLDIVGLLAVEMFVLKQPDKNGRHVLMNEIAPRPHNSGHWTIDACACSQYEQLVRAICGLPLGSTVPHSRAVMHNLIGADVRRWPDLLKDPDACLHLYGKTEERPGRKMGHVTWLKGAW